MNTKETTPFELAMLDEADFSNMLDREIGLTDRQQRLLNSLKEPKPKSVCGLIIDRNGNHIPLTMDDAQKMIISPDFDACCVPTRVLFNGPATILFWPDNTKTVVKCQEGDVFDPEKGVALAILKKLYGGGKYNDLLRRLLQQSNPKKETTT